MSDFELVSEVWLMCSATSASPQCVSVDVVGDKKARKYVSLVSNMPLELKKGLRWHRVAFKPTFAKYWKVSFLGNYGHPGQLCVQQVRVTRPAWICYLTV